jgi:hypothetical protein
MFAANTRPARTSITGEGLQRPLATQPPFSNTIAAIGFRATPVVISGASMLVFRGYWTYASYRCPTRRLT